MIEPLETIPALFALVAAGLRNCNLDFGQSAQNCISHTKQIALNEVLGFGNHNKARPFGNMMMSEPIQTNPTPTAVPWTPDMMTSQVPSPAPVQHTAPAQPQMHPAPYHPAPQYQALQPEYAQPPAQEAPQAYAPQPQPHMQPPQSPQQNMPQTQMAPPQYASMGQAPQHMPPQAPPMAQTQTQPHYAPPPQFAQPGMPPPLAPHMQVPPQAAEVPRESKSLLTKLLKRSPKPEPTSDIQAPAGSGSLFNKNFILGAVTGLVIGAFVLPMALNMIGGDTAAQAQASAPPMPTLDVTPAATEGDTFIDNAMSTDAP